MRLGFCFAVLVILMHLRESDVSKVLSTTNFDITIIHGPKFGTFLQGSTATLNCFARCSGDKNCKVSWHHNGYPIHPSEKHEYFANGSLQIIDFNEYDGGEYLCMVNSRSFARISNVVLLELAVIQNETQYVVEDVVVGDNVLMPCHVEGVPKPVVTWTKHSSHVFFTDRIISSVATESNSLQIMNITLKDEGLYKCHASNMAGKVVAAVFSVNVSRRVVPRPIRQLSKIRWVDAMLGEPVSLECLWSSSDSIWYRDGIRLMDLVKVGTSFFMDSVLFRDSGIYTCKNSKDLSLSMDINLTVNAMPFLLSKKEVHFKVRRGSAIQLVSVYTANPLAGIKWFKNGKVLLEKRRRMHFFDRKVSDVMQQSQLIVSNSTLSDFGIYQCMISNVFGVIEATYFVSVFEAGGPPKRVRAKPLMDGEIEVSWEPPADLEEPAVYSVYYSSEYDPSEKWMTTNQTRMKLIHLRPFTNYTFYVKAESDGETSAPSDFVSQMTNEEESPLSLPEFTLVVGNSSAVTIYWTKLSNIAASGVIITHKILLRSSKDPNLKTFLVDGSTYNFTLTNLKPETRYDVVVLSGNSIGYPDVEDFEDHEHQISPWQTIFLSSKEFGELYFPKDVEVKALNQSTVMITWKVEHLSEDMDLYGYGFEYKNHKNKTMRTFISYPQLHLILNNLVPGYPYKVSMHSKSMLGSGTPVTLNINTLEMLKVPVSLPNITLVVKNSSTVDVSWTKLSEVEANGVVVEHKILLKSFDSFPVKTFLVDGSTYNFTLTNLKSETRYEVMVLSGNGLGYPRLEDQPWRTIFLSADGFGELYFPQDLEVKALNQTSVMITWEVGRMHKDVDLYGYRFQYKDHRNKVVKAFVNYPQLSVILNGFVPGRSYEVVMRSASRLGPGTPASLNVNTLDLLKDLPPTVNDGMAELGPESSSFTTGKLIEFRSTSKRMSFSLVKQKANVLMEAKTSRPPSTENHSNAVLRAVAVNDTTVLVSFPAPLNVIDMEDVRICFGIDKIQAVATCKQWLNWGDLERDMMYINGLRPMTKYYFGVSDDNSWLGDFITCSTELPIPFDLKYSLISNNKLLVTWNIPETKTENDFSFLVSYAVHVDGLQSDWLSDYVEGSATFYVIEDYVADWDYEVEVRSVVGDVNSKSGVLHVKARHDESPKHPSPGSSVARISIVASVVVAVAIIGVVVSVVYVVAIKRRQLNSNSTFASPKDPQSEFDLKQINEDNQLQQSQLH